MVNLKIDGKNVVVPEGTTILDAAKQAGIDIPTLCFLKEINEVGDCRMCIVEVEGRKGFCNFMYTKGRRRNGCTYTYTKCIRSKTYHT